MFEKKDYIAYLKEILRVENTMRKEGKLLLKVAPQKECKMLLEKLISDEERHVLIVRDMIKLVTKNK